MNSACEEIIRLADKVIDGGEITEEEAKKLIRTKDEDTMVLLAMADKIRQKFGGNAVDFCGIINARSGHCQENCKFCAQSGWYHTGAKVYRLLPEEQILEAAKKAKAEGAARFSIVTSGRNQDNPNEFEEIIDLVKKIQKEVGIEVCCSLGLIARLISLKSAPPIPWKTRNRSSRLPREQASAYAPAESSVSVNPWTREWKWHSN